MVNFQEGFIVGLFVGFFGAAIMGMIFSQMREARFRGGQQHRKLDTFPDAYQTNLTPAGIVRKSWFARCGCLLWFLVLIGFLWVLSEVISTIWESGI